jgi:hypothetical protein
MKILRRVLIVLLIIANIGILIYVLKGIKEPPQQILAENVTTVTAPDQTEAQTPPEFIKKPFELVLPEGENVAKGKLAEADGYTDVYAANRCVDGSTDGGSYWEGTSNYPNHLTVDLKDPAKIHAIRIALNPLAIWGKRTQTISVNISSDGENFTELIKMKQYTFDPDEGNQVQLEFDEVETRYVQLVITENSGAGGGQIAEFEIYSK